MLSKLISLPFALVALFLLYITWEYNTAYAIYLVIPIICLAVIYTMSPQIDWWWYQRHPPQLDEPLAQFIAKNSAFYQKLSVGAQQKFRERVALYIFANEFTAQGTETAVPEDIKGVIAANVVHLTFGREDFLLNKFERIILYRHPFPSPQYLNHWHASEIHEEDGVILFSAEHLMMSFVNPQKFYNIGLHEYAKIFVLSYPQEDYPAFDEKSWLDFEKISGFSQELISKWIGLPDIEPLPVGIVLFLTFPEKFQAVLPVAYQRLQGNFSTKFLIKRAFSI